MIDQMFEIPFSFLFCCQSQVSHSYQSHDLINESELVFSISLTKGTFPHLGVGAVNYFYVNMGSSPRKPLLIFLYNSKQKKKDGHNAMPEALCAAVNE